MSAKVKSTSENGPKRRAKKRIIIADDHPVVREGFEHIISVQENLEVCGKAASVREALALVEKLKPDLVVADLTFPERSGLELIKDLKSLHPEIPVLVMSMHDEMIYAERVLRAGGRGYLMKDSAADFLVEAIWKVLNGDAFTSQAVIGHLLRAIAGEPDQQIGSFPLKRLTDRELEVFEQIGNGKSTQEIAERLQLSPRTVDTRKSHIRKKLGLADTAVLNRYAVRWVESGALEGGGGTPGKSPAP